MVRRSTAGIVRLPRGVMSLNRNTGRRFRYRLNPPPSFKLIGASFPYPAMLADFAASYPLGAFMYGPARVSPAAPRVEICSMILLLGFTVPLAS